jgi:regulatory protein
VVTTEDEQEFVLTPEIVLKYSIAPRKEFTDEEFIQILEEDALRQAKDQALRYLSIRPHSRQELFRKMREKGYRKPVIEQVLADLERLDLVNDEQFARLFIQNELRLRPAGRALLKQKLLSRGIPQPLCDRLLSELFPESLELEFVHRLAEKFLKHKEHLPPTKRREKLVRYLQSKGFHWEQIQEVVALVQD